jgi:putative ABC transport system permease protein
VLLALAAASLRRHAARTALAVLGVAVAAAMLLDMTMLATGMRESFRRMLDVRGFALRVSPAGTLPFDTEATIGGAAAIAATLRTHPDVETVAPVLGAALHVARPDGGRLPAVGLGIDHRVQGDYEITAGREARGADEVVVNARLLERAGRALGDTLLVATGYDPQLRTVQGERRVVVVGIGRFFYLAADQAAAALPLATLQAMAGPSRTDRVSLFMLRAREGADVEAVRAWIAERLPRVNALSTATALEAVDERLSYFRQLAVILGAVSLVVGFLLVTTLVTVSVNERVGEIAVMRAIGVRRGRVVGQIVLEGLAISLTGTVAGLLLGLATGRWLNSILKDFPGLPAAIDFFLFQPRAAFVARGLLLLSGFAAGAYPAWRAASLPIARTLREEAVA